MKLISLVVGIIIVVILGVWLLANSESISSLNEDPLKPAVAESRLQKGPDQDRREQWQLKGSVLEIDPNRLYEKGYENNPAVQALAKAHRLPPACIIALAKYRFDQVPLESGVCPHARDAIEFPTLAVGEDHPYNQYSNSELRTLATSSADAAVILARRLESDAEARNMYERAVALSGIAEPLVEWMTQRETGGLFYNNGELELEAAKEGYEVLLTAAAFGGASESAIELYQEELRNYGVNPRPIEIEAKNEVAQIRKLRRELTGGERP